MDGKFFLKNFIVFFLVSSSSQLKKKSESKGWIWTPLKAFFFCHWCTHSDWYFTSSNISIVNQNNLQVQPCQMFQSFSLYLYPSLFQVLGIWLWKKYVYKRAKFHWHQYNCEYLKPHLCYRVSYLTHLYWLQYRRKSSVNAGQGKPPMLFVKVEH